MAISSVRGALSFNALMNLPTSAMYCLCRFIRYSDVLSFIRTNSRDTQLFHNNTNAVPAITLSDSRYYKIY